MAERQDGAITYVGAERVFGSPGAAGPAWTLRGKPVPPFEELPAWKVNGPLFMVAGEMDVFWNSGNALTDLARVLRAHHRRDFTALVYPGAGHAIGAAVPYLPYGNVYFNYGVPHSFGGSVAADARVRADAWPKLLEFLHSLSAAG